MSILTSILADLLQVAPELRPQLYFKSSLTALSHAMENQVLAGLERPLVIASFQRERFYRQEAHRYRRIAARTPRYTSWQHRKRILKVVRTFMKVWHLSLQTGLVKSGT